MRRQSKPKEDRYRVWSLSENSERKIYARIFYSFAFRKICKLCPSKHAYGEGLVNNDGATQMDFQQTSFSSPHDPHLFLRSPLPQKAHPWRDEVMTNAQLEQTSYLTQTRRRCLGPY